MGASEPSAVQWLLDLVIGAVLTIGGGIVKAVRDDQRDMRAAHDKLVEGLPDTYARRDDVKEGFADLKRQHAEISGKLDRLIERS